MSKLADIYNAKTNYKLFALFQNMLVMRKSYCCLILLCNLFLFSEVFSQSVSIGGKAGISVPNLTSGGSSNPLNTGYMSGLGPDASIFGEYHVSHLFSVEASIEYSFQGGKKNGKQALPVTPDVAALFPPGTAPEYLWANFDAELRMSYLMIPVLGKFGFDLGNSSAFRIYADAGPFVGFLLSAKTITKGSSNVYADEAMTEPLLLGEVSFDSTMDIKSSLKNVNFGIEANIGLSYTFGEHSIFIEGGGNYGFVYIQKDKADGQNRAGAAVVRIGYAYTFGQKNPHQKSVKEPKVF
jgi:hypothetical protein